ncbi:MAG: hypothetical protein WC878_01625 [Candidatus Paceibacterota bacterium]
MRNRKDEKIIELYIEHFFSMAQIGEQTDLSVSKVCDILEKYGIKRRNRSEAISNLNITKYKKHPFLIKKTLSTEDEKLKLAGIMLYWGEGTKNGNTVAFSNSNPEMIVVFLRFLRVVCGISDDRLKALLHIYQDHDDDELKSFWVKKTGIPEKNFYKSFVHGVKTGTYKQNSKYGTISLRYSDKKLLHTINDWILEYAKYLVHKPL